MNSVLHKYTNKIVLVYLGDILMYSKSTDKHEGHLHQVFMQLCKHKHKAKHSNCDFAHSYVKYLGHMVGSGKLCVDPDKASSVANWVTP